MEDIDLVTNLKAFLEKNKLALPENLRHDIQEFIKNDKILLLQSKPRTRKLRKENVSNKTHCYTRKKKKGKSRKRHRHGKKNKTRKK